MMTMGHSARLQIIRVDNDVVEKAELCTGTNRIGRSDAAAQDVRPDERYRFRIDVTPDNEIFLTPAVSCCYAKFHDSPKWQLLGKGNIVPVRPGDVFSLLPERCWFKIISIPAGNAGEGDSGGQDKPEERTVDPGCSLDRISVNHHRQENVGQCVEMSETTATSENVRTTLNPANRSVCKYGQLCYRRSAEHKAKFSHPGDPDYDKMDDGGEEDRPECPYGTRCYRKNPLHLSRYKHATTGSQRRGRSRRAVTLDQRSNDDPEDSEEEESVDESDYEPEMDGDDRTTDDETDTDGSYTDD